MCFLDRHSVEGFAFLETSSGASISMFLEIAENRQISGYKGYSPWLDLERKTWSHSFSLNLGSLLDFFNMLSFRRYVCSNTLQNPHVELGPIYNTTSVPLHI